VAFHSSGLGEEEVADHGDVVRHGGSLPRKLGWVLSFV